MFMLTPPPRELALGLSFEKAQCHLRINKEKTLILWLKTNNKFEDKIVEISSDNAKIIIKGGGRSEIHKTDKEGTFRSKIRIEGRQLRERGTICARIKGYEPAYSKIQLEEVGPKSEFMFKLPKPVDENFEPLRYKWDFKDPLLLLIGASHPSIKKYLSEPAEQRYPGINSPLNYKLSPSDFSFLYEGCKRCYHLKVVHNISQPSIPLPSIFSKIASLALNRQIPPPPSLTCQWCEYLNKLK